jgi:transcriptional regulator with AAA-type ATPase domain
MRSVIRDYPEALKAMGDYAWPGNVREVANKIRKALVLGSDHNLKPKDLDLPDPEVSGQGEESAEGGNGRGKIEKEKVIETLQLCRHNISRLQHPGVSRLTVYHLKRKFGSEETNYLAPEDAEITTQSNQELFIWTQMNLWAAPHQTKDRWPMWPPAGWATTQGALIATICNTTSECLIKLKTLQHSSTDKNA